MTLQVLDHNQELDENVFPEIRVHNLCRPKVYMFSIHFIVQKHTCTAVAINGTKDYFELQQLGAGKELWEIGAWRAGPVLVRDVFLLLHALASC